MDWNSQIAPYVLAAWHEGLVGNEQLFKEESHEDNVRGFFVEPLRTRFAKEGFVVDSPYDRMNSSDLTRVRKKISCGGIVSVVVPDIVIHRRQENALEGNLLPAEIKK